MENKVAIKEKLISVGLTLGCYDTKIEKLSKKDMKKLIDNIEFGSTDVGVSNNKLIVEVIYVDNEVDLSVATAAEYAKTYGRIFSDAR
jgi:hypothetical protein